MVTKVKQQNKKLLKKARDNYTTLSTFVKSQKRLYLN